MSTQTLTSRPASFEQEIPRLRQLAAANRYAEALAQLHSPLAEYSENRDLLLLAAICQRILGRIDEALVTLNRLATLHPRFSLMHQERGLCHIARKEVPAAIDALQSAVNINTALPVSWRMLEDAYRVTGDRENAAMAASHRAILATLQPELVTATSLFADGDLWPAEQMVCVYLQKHGKHPEALRLLARIAIAHDVLDDAEMLLEGAVALAPENFPARYDYARCLLARQKHLQAREELQHLLTVDPRHRDYRSLAAAVAVGLGEHERAIDLYRDLLADMPDSPDLHLWLGHALKTIGRLPDAIEAYRVAATARPDFGDAYWSLANLKTYRFSNDEIARMRAGEAAPSAEPEDRQHLCFALGKALEDQGETAESWRYYEKGNALKRLESGYRPEIAETNTRKQIEVCTRDFFDRRAGWGDPRPEPIFIIGLPRSGSTLLEQILASHSQVEGTQELPDIQHIVHEMQEREADLDNPRYPGVLADLTEAEFRSRGETYLTDTQTYRTDTPKFVDKAPNNFRHVGLIHLMLPGARIIDARREPMACCFSNLKQLFASGQDFAYSIEDIARYYRTYLDLMQHWDRALPGRVLRVHYEDVVADLEGSVRRILDHCGLPFEAACIDFHKSKRAVQTPSSEQVRQPIFRDGLDQWIKYQRWLQPLREVLGDAPDRYRI
jgi:tetratricopeptide (TPR) repeat protein